MSSRDGGRFGAARIDAVTAPLALVGSALGVAAGLLELTIGPSIRDWVGDKRDTTSLGLATTLLAAVALLATFELRRPRPRGEGHRVAVAIGLLVPALVCFTTVGRLWDVPGALLTAAGALVLSTTGREEYRRAFDEPHWRSGLLVLCGSFYIVLGATAAGVGGALGVIGGVLIWAVARKAPAGPGRRNALLLLGVLPFTLLTWWSVATPLLAIVTLLVGQGVIRDARTGTADSRWDRSSQAA